MTVAAKEKTIHPAQLKEAADWAISLHYESPGAVHQQAFERWLNTSPAHEDAWQRAQAVFETFKQIDSNTGKTAVRNLQQNHLTRRRALELFSTAFITLSAGWIAHQQLPWQRWTAQVATRTGEQKSLALPDGSRLVLNTASAIDIIFSEHERRVRLIDGEILITTHADSAPTPRPFLVETNNGLLRALGTRFSVRQLDKSHCRLAVFEHAVELHNFTSGQKQQINAGKQIEFAAHGNTAPIPLDNSNALWEKGILLAKGMRLGDVVAELSRYRPGILRCAPEVNELLVSGSLSLVDTEASLALLEKNLPVQISRTTNYWVTVSARI
ncbi:MAG: FecR domain-containing protein [Cellvibrio sp.]|uniref:FecR domain-containing protein n=1 Tax=Cellvibrio sp. TaxID=1965322 RepID=UPI0031B04EF1